RDEPPAPMDEVLSAALHAFATHGYQGVSVRTLNRELGVSHNLLHQRFGSKLDIWYAAVEWGFGRLTEELGQALSGATDPLEQLRRFIRTFVEFSARHPDLQRLVIQEGGSPSERLTHLLDRYVRPTVAALAPTLVGLVRSHQVRPVPPEVVYHLVTSAGTNYSSDALTRELFGAGALAAESIPRYAEAVATVILDGLTT
ncbi:MAG: TetR/AcrR family transcriptional regulator, partial [Actinomycetota bacterium]|nr:TetR/AcrR family transcriptional regulator [Actinomycetota bacterium]